MSGGTTRWFGVRPSFLSLGPMTRARDIDRDAAIVALREGMVDGQLTQDEFDARSAAVLAATRVGELTKLTSDLQAPPPEAFEELKPKQPRWRRLFGPLIIVLVVAGLLAGVEGLTKLGAGNDGMEDSDDSFGFPGLDFPGKPALHTADGMATLLADMRETFGTTETMRAVVYPDYAVIWMPQPAPADDRVDTYYYDGNFDDASPSGTRDVDEEPVFDLAELDLDAMALLVLQAPDAIGVDDPESTYVVVDPTYDTKEPRLSIYVSDEYVSGRLEADLDGTVTDLYEAS